MNFNPKVHHRRSVRLKGYDYALPGAYFITICTFLHQCLFGEIVDRVMFPNEMGKVVAEEWVRSPQIRPTLQMDEWTVMPNHIHGIVIVTALDSLRLGASAAADRAPQACNTNPGIRSVPKLHRKPRSLSSFVGGFKSAVTTRVNMIRGTPRKPVWQVNYHEHIIRNEEALRQIRKYIKANAWMWKYDKDNPVRSAVEIEEIGDECLKKFNLSKEDLKFILDFDNKYRKEEEEDS